MTYESALAEMRGWLEIRARPGQFSAVLVEQLAKHCIERTVNVFSVLDEIGKLQGTWKGTSLGQPEQFKHKPLVGLWKQHFFEARNLLRNLHNELHSKQSRIALEQIASGINSGSGFDEGLHELIIGGHQRRAQAGSLTGEWIVYAKDEGGSNYFLTLAEHNECPRGSGEDGLDWRRRSDSLIYQRVVACRLGFPHLKL